jgi:SulP family sulfate permease
MNRFTELLPRRSDYAGVRHGWKTDLVAGITVGIVALPLALAFGITTGMGARAGMITAIVAGLVAGVFGGSNVQVSGPTGAMTVVLVPIVARYGTDAVLVVGLIAGILVTAAAIGRLGRYLAYIPWPVVEGFTVGIAIIIFLQQVPTALGVPRPEGENTAAVAIRAVRDAISNGSLQSISLVGLVIAIMVLVPRIRGSLPASLIAVAVATIVAQIGSLNVSKIGLLPNSLPLPSFPSTSFSEVRHLLSAGFAVALLASIESLLSAKVADGMSDGQRHNPNRELFGQGLANLVSPLFGGMPATGAIARTAVNVRSGARTRMAAITHAILLLLVVFLGGQLVSKIPLAALAGVLIVTAYRMVEKHNVIALIHSTRSDASILLATTAATIAFDLIIAVEIGVALAAFLALRQIAMSSEAQKEDLPVDELTDSTGEIQLRRNHVIVYRIDGVLFFGAAQRFLTELTVVSDVKVVILRLSQVQVLDATGAQALGEIVRELESRGITVLLKGLRERHKRILKTVGALDHLAHENHLFDTLDKALEHARMHVARTIHSPGSSIS